MVWREAADFGETSSKKGIGAIEVRDGRGRRRGWKISWTGRKGVEGKNDRVC